MFMAFHTRNVKIQSLNEAIEIAGLVYINTIILVVVIVAGFAFDDYHDTHASLYGLAMIVDATLFLTLTFLPKVSSYWPITNSIIHVYHIYSKQYMILYIKPSFLYFCSYVHVLDECLAHDT